MWNMKSYCVYYYSSRFPECIMYVLEYSQHPWKYFAELFLLCMKNLHTRGLAITDCIKVASFSSSCICCISFLSTVSLVILDYFIPHLPYYSHPFLMMYPTPPAPPQLPPPTAVISLAGETQLFSSHTVCVEEMFDIWSDSNQEGALYF